MIKIILMAFVTLSMALVEDPAFASGAAAARRDPATGRSTIQAPPTTVQGPPINLGPRQRTIRQDQRKSVNLPPVLPYERREEAPKPKAAPKKTQQYYPPSQILTSSGPKQNTSTLARTSPPAQRPGDDASISPEMAAVLDRLDRSSELWLSINDARAKGAIVSRYIDLYKQFGVQISKPPDYYVNLIDGMAQNNSGLLAQPFDQVLRIVAILEYDYDSGENKDALAAGILTDRKAFLQNRQRLGLK